MSTKEDIVKELLNLYRSKPQYVDVVKKVLEAWEKYKSEFKCLKCGSSRVEVRGVYYKCLDCGTMDTVLGMDTSRIPVPPAYITKLIHVGALVITYRSRRYRCVAVVDEEAMKESLELFEKEKTEKGVGKPLEVPDDLFRNIVGLDDVKETVMRALRASKPVHVLLIGPPASAKSQMIEEIWNRVKGTYLVLAGSSTRAGIRDVIAEYTPHVLLIDELDKVNNTNDLSVLLSWMQSQRIVITMHGRYDIVECPYPDGCKVIAACNDESRIPRELRSRFVRKYIKEYTPEQVVEICKSILTNEEGVKKELAEYVGKAVVSKLRSRDPRDCVKVVRLLTKQTKEEVDKVIKYIRGY